MHSYVLVDPDGSSVSQASIPDAVRDKDGRRLRKHVADWKKSLYRLRKCAVVPKSRKATRLWVTPGMKRAMSIVAVLVE